MSPLEKAARPGYTELVTLTQEQGKKLGDVVDTLERIRVQHRDSAKLDSIWRDRWIEECQRRKTARNWGIARALVIPVAGVSVAMMDSSNPIKTSLVVIFEYLKGMI